MLKLSLTFVITNSLCILFLFVPQDGVLLALKEPLAASEEDAVPAADDEDPYLVVHPNYVIE